MLEGGILLGVYVTWRSLHCMEGTTADEAPLRGGMGAGGGAEGRFLMAERECDCLWICCTEGFSEAGDCSLGESSWTKISRYFWNRAPCVVG